MLHWQQDREKHQEIWNIFTKLIPASQRNVSVFYITTDGIDGIGGGVERDVDDISKWHLFYDISDAYPTEIIDDKEIIYTTIHEFGLLYAIIVTVIAVILTIIVARAVANAKNK